jgi:hypothetical protein
MRREGSNINAVARLRELALILISYPKYMIYRVVAAPNALLLGRHTRRTAAGTKGKSAGS